jgi:hypothetical protein
VILKAIVILLAKKVHRLEHSKLAPFETCMDPTCMIAAALERDPRT